MRPADIARLVGLGGTWGASYLFIKVALESYTTVQIVGIRLVIGALVMYGLMRLKGFSLPRERRVWALILYMSLMGHIIPFLLITWGEESVSSSLTGILNSTTPLFTLMFAALFIPGENLRPLRVFGIALGFVGVPIIVGGDLEGSNLAGQIAIVLASLTYGTAFVWARRFLSGRPVWSLSAAQLSLSAALMLIPTLISVVSDPPSVTMNETLSLLALGALGTGVAFYFYYQLIADVGATTASFAIYLIPIFSVALGWIVLGEKVGWNALAGAALVIAGIAIAQRAALPVGAGIAPGEGGGGSEDDVDGARNVVMQPQEGSAPK